MPRSCYKVYEHRLVSIAHVVYLLERGHRHIVAGDTSYLTNRIGYRRHNYYDFMSYP